MLRVADVQKATGYPRTSVYQKIQEGLFPRAVSMGLRTAVWPKHEVEAIVSARMAGDGDEEIRALVKELMNDRLGEREPVEPEEPVPGSGPGWPGYGKLR